MLAMAPVIPVRLRFRIGVFRRQAELPHRTLYIRYIRTVAGKTWVMKRQNFGKEQAILTWLRHRPESWPLKPSSSRGALCSGCVLPGRLFAQREVERRSFVDFTGGPYPAAVSLDDALRES